MRPLLRRFARPAMAPVASLSRARFMLVSDLDGTLVDPRDPSHAALRRFNALWNKYCFDARLVYSTGRSQLKYQQLRAAGVPLLEPDALICSVGTELYRKEAASEPDKAWSAVLDKGWNRDALLTAVFAVPGLTLQEKSEQRRHKISLKARPGTESGAAFGESVAELRKRLNATGVPYELIVSSGCDVDVLPCGANKGAALQMLLEELAEEEAGGGGGAACAADVAAAVGVAERTLATGDSGNDIQLLSVNAVRAAAVGNAQPELRAWCAEHASARVYVARAECADGVAEALKHFGFLLDGATAEPDADGV